MSSFTWPLVIGAAAVALIILFFRSFVARVKDSAKLEELEDAKDKQKAADEILAEPIPPDDEWLRGDKGDR